MGAMATSFMNEKKDTAMAQVETITNEFRATAAKERPRAPGRKSCISPWRRMPSERQTSPTVAVQMTIRTRTHFMARLRD
jgi:hypothetical protein